MAHTCGCSNQLSCELVDQMHKVRLTSRAEGEQLSYHAFVRAVNSSKSPLGSLVFTGSGTPSSGSSSWSKLLVSSGFAILGLKGASIFLASSDCHCSFL